MFMPKAREQLWVLVRGHPRWMGMVDLWARRHTHSPHLRPGEPPRAPLPQGLPWQGWQWQASPWLPFPHSGEGSGTRHKHGLLEVSSGVRSYELAIPWGLGWGVCEPLQYF